MELLIETKEKKDKFITLFKSLKNISNNINLRIDETGLFIQMMDYAKICLAEIFIQKKWFDNFDVKKNQTFIIGINNKLFSSILSCNINNGSIKLHYKKNDDYLYSIFKSNNSNDIITEKDFKIPLISIEEDLLNVPKDVEYEADISIKSSLFHDIVNEIGVFSDTITLYADDEKVNLETGNNSNETTCNYNINIDIEKLEEFSIEEDCIIQLSYSSKHLMLLSSFHKLSNFVCLNFSKEKPILIQYNLDDTSYANFYLAPKIE